jgi:hypothetical protein
MNSARVTCLVLSGLLAGTTSIRLEQRAITIKTLCADPAQDPTPVAAAVLKVVRVVGASVMHASVYAPSVDMADVDCDEIEFTLLNKGSEPFQFSCFSDAPTVPLIDVQALVDGAWKNSFPVVDGDGKARICQNSGYRGAVRDVVVKPSGSWTFLVHLERWKYSVVQKLRIRLECSRPLTSPGGVSEDVTSNGFALKD